MRKNWWWFAMWHFGPSWRHINWRLVYDLRHWQFGVSYYSGWTFTFGPFRLEQMQTFLEPQRGDYMNVVK